LAPPDKARYSVRSTGGLSPIYAFSTSAYELAGYIFDELHRPVAGATVRHEGDSATSDSSGHFVWPAA